MDRKTFIERLFARAEQAGLDAYEAYYASSDSFDTQVLKGEILQYNVSTSMELGFRALLNGRMGYASTQALDEDAIDLLIDSVKSNAMLIESDDPQFIYPGDAHYASPQIYCEALSEIGAAEKIRLARELEKRVLDADPRIEQADSCTVMSVDEELALVNSRGLDVSLRRNVLAGYVEPIARDGDKVNTGFKFFCASDPSEIAPDKTARDAVQEALDGLHAATVPSGTYRVLLRADAAIDLLRVFSSVFSADAAQRGMSLLKGREGAIVAAGCVSILDHPHMDRSASSTPFDGEGVATRFKRIVDHGRLTTLLHNLKTAAKQGVQTTGNAARGSGASPVGVAPTNFYIEPSETPRDALLAQLGDGLLITDLQGLHAGANPISGDFSLSARGYRVKAGRPAEAVHQLTIAGNFFEVLQSIEAVGSDLEFSFPTTSRFGSPSLLIPAISVAGATK